MADSFFKRTFELTKLSVKVGLKELKSGDLKSRIEQAKMITETLSQLKGAAMKAGQMLSIELDDYFPPEAVQIISQLQNRGTEVNFKIIEATLKKELGLEKFNKLENINPKPIASASIAQIHLAEYKGKKVVLKVQHPGVAKSINSDVALIKKVAQSFVTMSGRKMNLNPLFAEMKSVLNQEVDFEQEVEYLKKYRKLILGISHGKDKYYSPEPYSNMNTKKVITMSWEEGLSINDWLQTTPSQKKKEKLAHLVLNLYCYEFYHWGLVQTDPNFANFLVREEDGDIGLVLLDFGATREYDKDFRTQYLNLIENVHALKNAKDQDAQKAEIIRIAVDFNLIDRRENQEANDLFIEILNLAVEPFFASEKNNKFSFGNQEYNKRAKESVKKFLTSLKYSAPPHRLLFLHRKLGGISSLLRRLDVDLDLSRYWLVMFKEMDQD
jgi:aarF domain-containing kinase